MQAALLAAESIEVGDGEIQEERLAAGEVIKGGDEFVLRVWR